MARGLGRARKKKFILLVLESVDDDVVVEKLDEGD